MLSFIRRNGEGKSDQDSVISMCKVKSVEYEALSLIVKMLKDAVDA